MPIHSFQLLIHSSLDYIEVRISINKKDPILDLLKQDLCDIGYESFTEEEMLISAFIPSNVYSKKKFDICAKLYTSFIDSIKYINHPHQNWNELWESNFDSININDSCVIRASFHAPQNLKYEIIIDPDMSFGTGHHQTTRLIAKDLFSHSITNKKVLDFGCGTGILSIIAEKLDASSVDAIDIDQNAIVNARSNARKNKCKKIRFYNGDGQQLPNTAYDLIIANINKNVIIEQFNFLYKVMKNETLILFSGFFDSDINSIENLGQQNGLITLYSSLENNWALLVMKFK